jgi:hypothetical protein
MSGIGPSIGHDRYGRGGAEDPLYLAQIQKDKENEGHENTIANPRSKFFALVASTLYFKKFIDHFTNIAKSLSPSINTEKALQDLRDFKKILEELCREDKSHDPEFTQRLSLIWQNVYENSSGLEFTAGQLDQLASEILQFIHDVDKYPPGEDFSLGYYLNEHAGQDWIPFPFMKLLSLLHEDFLTSPTTAKLGLWTRKLNEILGTFE